MRPIISNAVAETEVTLKPELIRHDDHPLSQYACPSLTTVAQDVERLATISLERMMLGIADGANQNSNDLLEARLIMRESA